MQRHKIGNWFVVVYNHMQRRIPVEIHRVHVRSALNKKLRCFGTRKSAKQSRQFEVSFNFPPIPTCRCRSCESRRRASQRYTTNATASDRHGVCNEVGST